MLIIFYDGSCNFCARQVEPLRPLDGIFELIDISSEPGTPGIYGIQFADAAAEPHGIDDDTDEVFKNFNLVLEIWRRMDSPAYKVFRLPVLKQIGSIGFWLLSKLRKWL